jgi:CRISPR system Cascade subunit CasB
VPLRDRFGEKNLPQYLSLVSRLYQLQIASEGGGKNPKATGPARAQLASLRGGFARGLTQNYNAFPIIAPFLAHDDSEWAVRNTMLVASLFALHKGVPEGEKEQWWQDESFGATVATLANAGDSDGMDRRFFALLDADPEELPHHLQWMVQMAASHRVDIFWKRFAQDVPRLMSNDPEWSDKVKLQWARDYWARKKQKGNGNDTDDES